MAFSSMDIIKGQQFEADFYVRDDNGIEYKNLQGANAEFDMRWLDSKNSANVSSSMSIRQDDEEIWFARMIISSSVTNSLSTIVEGEDDGYMHRSPYYGVLAINNVAGETSPILLHIDKVNVVKG